MCINYVFYGMNIVGVMNKGNIDMQRCCVYIVMGFLNVVGNYGTKAWMLRNEGCLKDKSRKNGGISGGCGGKNKCFALYTKVCFIVR
jgi:hypothetical protein